jgi:hypothetical protein
MLSFDVISQPKLSYLFTLTTHYLGGPIKHKGMSYIYETSGGHRKFREFSMENLNEIGHLGNTGIQGRKN